MNKKIGMLLLALALCASLAACASPAASAQNAQSVQQSGQTAGQQGTPGAPNMANQPIEGKLAVGLLKLEGTDQAVTAAQAKTLLPLWKALKSLSSSSTASSDEISALYTQIQEALSTDQLAAIKALNLSPSDTQALMQQYNVQMQQMPTQRATRSASNSQGGGGFGGPGGGAGGPPPDGGGMPGGGMPGGQGGSQSTPVAGMANRPQMGGGMGLIFVDPLIKLLETRAAS